MCQMTGWKQDAAMRNIIKGAWLDNQYFLFYNIV